MGFSQTPLYQALGGYRGFNKLLKCGALLLVYLLPLKHSFWYDYCSVTVYSININKVPNL